MNFHGFVINADKWKANKEPVPFATVSVYLGNVLLRGTVANQYGEFYISAEPGTRVVFTSVGYYPDEQSYNNMVAADDIWEGNIPILLKPKVNTLPEVVVTANKKNNNTALWLSAAALAALAISGKNKKRISGIPETIRQNKDIILWGGGILLAGTVGVKLLQNIGLFESKEERESRKERERLLKQSEAEILSKQQPTKTFAEWKAIADIIYNDLKFSSVSDNKEDAGYQVSRVQNDADLITLSKAFGTRQEYWFGIPIYGDQDFFQFVASNLSRSKLNAINDNYARKGISFRW